MLFVSAIARNAKLQFLHRNQICRIASQELADRYSAGTYHKRAFRGIP